MVKNNHEIDLIKTLSFFPENAPTSLRYRAMEDLSIISKVALKVWPRSTGAIYGSLSFGEGKWKEYNDKAIMTSDYDVYIIINNLFDYIKALKHKNDFKRFINIRISLPLSVTFIWQPLVNLRLVSVQARVIWGDLALEKAFEQTPPPPTINNLRIGYLFLIRSLTSGLERRDMLESAIVRALWSYLLSSNVSRRNWHNIFSLKYDLNYLKEEKDLDPQIKNTIESVLKKKLSASELNKCYTDDKLFETAKFILHKSYNRTKVKFRLKDYIHYICYKLDTKSLTEIWTNFTKVRLEMFRSLVDLIDRDFDIKDQSRFDDIMLKAERMLGYEKRKDFKNKNEKINYCCNLMIKLGNIYIHKTRAFP